MRTPKPNCDPHTRNCLDCEHLWFDCGFEGILDVELSCKRFVFQLQNPRGVAEFRAWLFKARECEMFQPFAERLAARQGT